ncbi:MAG TPA: hypothetical protein VM123_15135 [archaeon]|nr:hypothetical protein [archaeon]
MSGKKLGIFILCCSGAWVHSVLAQGATLRLNYADLRGYRALRPARFEIANIGRVKYGKTLDRLNYLGEFVNRYGENPDSLPPKLGIDGSLQARAKTRLSAAAIPGKLRLTVACQEPEPERMASEFDGYYPDDRVEILLDLNHDHQTFFLISVLPTGQSRIEGFEVRENHLSWDRNFKALDQPLEVKSQTTHDSAGWTLTADIDLSGAPGAVHPWMAVGFNAARYRGVNGEEITMWCPDSNKVRAPLYFGDLYLGEPPLVVSSVDLGMVCWGENQGVLRSQGARTEVSLGVTSRNYREIYNQETFVFKNGICNLIYKIDPHELMRSNLALSLDNMPWGSYEFGWKGGLLLTHRPGMRGNAGKPGAGENDYYWKFCRCLLARLPVLSRSDDGLSLVGESIRVDLRANDALSALASILSERFETDEERLAGAALLLCQEGVMVSSRTGELLSHPLGGLGILRVGAAFCNSYAELLRDLVNLMRDSSGQPFKACVVNYKDGPVNTFGWPHHWVAGVAYRGGITLLDAELGVFFVNPKTGRLATLQELLRNPELAEYTSHGLSEYFRNRKSEDFWVREAGDLWGVR